MPSSQHSPKALADLQARYTKVTTAVVALKAAGVNTAAAAEAATAFDLQLAVRKEDQPALT